MFCLVDPLSVLTINDEDETLGPSIIVSPKRPDLILATDIPHIEFHILVGYGFNIEANCQGESHTR